VSRARAKVLFGFLAVGLWAAWFLPPLVRAPELPTGSKLVALWMAHMLPLFTLLLAPVLGLEATCLFAFPTALVLPFAGAAVLGWELAEKTQPADLALAAGAFLLYAVAAPLALRRSRAPRIGVEVRPTAGRAPAPRLERALGAARSLATALLPLTVAYAAHFDRRLQILLEESFGASAGYATVLVDLTALALGIAAADLAFFAPLRGLRGKSGPAEIAAEVEERLQIRSTPRLSAGLSLAGAAIFLTALAAYRLVRPE
jgi:hypothetical protein